MADNEQTGSPQRYAVEVAFALPDRQKIVALDVAPGTTAEQAVVMAELHHYFPEMSAQALHEAPLGIFGKALRDRKRELQPGDRVEVYRPLKIDPKEARRQRASRGSMR